MSEFKLQLMYGIALAIVVIVSEQIAVAIDFPVSTAILLALFTFLATDRILAKYLTEDWFGRPEDL